LTIILGIDPPCPDFSRGAIAVIDQSEMPPGDFSALQQNHYLTMEILDLEYAPFCPVNRTEKGEPRIYYQCGSIPWTRPYQGK
jgi:hypothetical protein